MTNREFKERLSWSSRGASQGHPSKRTALALATALVAQLMAVPAAWAEPGDKDEAAAISQVAGAKAKAGEFALCAALFHQAYAKDPGYLAYLFSAARCAQKAGELDSAERDFRTYLARCPKGDKLAEKADQYLAEILEERKKAPPAAPTPAATPGPDKAGFPDKAGAPDRAAVPDKPAGAPHLEPPAPVEKSADLAPKTPAVVRADQSPSRGGLWLALGGVALMAGGAVLWAQGQSQASDLDSELGGRGDGLVLNQSHAAAMSRQDDANRAIGLGLGVAVVGALLTGAGSWWWLKAPADRAGISSVRLGPGPAAMGVSLQWAMP